MPPNEDLNEWFDILERVLGLICVGFLVWTMFPGLRVEVSGAISNYRQTFKTRREWERMRNEMAWETWLVEQSLDGEGPLADRLQIAD
jgi:hypothetical protein